MNVSLQVISDSPPTSPTIHGDTLIDSHGRQIKDLRLSVTDRCNFRCVYCMEPDVKYLPKMSLLTLDEYVRLVEIAMSLGIEKLRITGGEPTLYPHLDSLIETVGSMGLKDIALTTNGSRLTMEMCKRWKAYGLHRITVSLDTLKPERKDAITRSFTPLDTVIRAIDMARDAGLTPVKVNAVIMRGVNDDELCDFADFAQAAFCKNPRRASSLAPSRKRVRIDHSSSLNKHGRTVPSAMIRIRSHPPQNERVTDAMMPSLPRPPSKR